MPKFKAVILTPASSDIDQIADYYLLMVGPLSAEKITDKLLDAILRLEDFPLSGTEHPDPELHKLGFRKIMCGDYACIYKIIDKNVYIYRVVHSAADYTKLLK